MPHLVVSITGHGYGHVAQTAPVLNRLHELVPNLRLTVRSTVPESHLRLRIHAPFELMPSTGDIGMVMSSALDVRVEESRAAYRDFHRDWTVRVETEAALLRNLDAGMVLSNVGYLALAGAQQAGIPNAALCSLNWADIYRHYCGGDEIAAQIRDCYAQADAFLRATPGMAMADLPNVIPLDPIASLGRNRREELDRNLGLPPTDRLVLVSLGGIASRLPMENWPRIEGIRYLVQRGWNVAHPDAFEIESLPMNFGDLLASSDALLCKPGYGSFAEAACGGIPVLYVDRPDWPEAPALVVWLQRNGICREVSRDALMRGEIAGELEDLVHRPRKPAPEAGGIAQATAWLAEKLAG